MNGLMEEGSTTTTTTREGGLAQVRLRARVGQLFDSRGTTARERASERARALRRAGLSQSGWSYFFLAS